ncbi:HNH endonuclease [Burkholderia sp. SIMBA_043]|uniref:HNH endonuclease n=1 Tax=Burkholderia TaxID=32008 RepID=UPI0005D97854|nr:HNH endonuclease [Burkholderia vietnamiensis]AJY06750.1 HNH endonuclease family protein [Burkholderia vietnamiensis LMG 10929]UBI27556.1 HNH endonuclease [Burkholderia vietnamiensis]
MHPVEFSADVIEQLRAQIQYNPRTGLIRNRETNRVLSGAKVLLRTGGHVRSVQIGRAIYALHKGEDLPQYHVIVYRDSDSTNRKWSNLKVIRRSELDKVARTPPNLTQYYTFFHECFRHDKKTGYLIWRKRPVHHFVSESIQRKFNTRFAGKRAGTPQGREGRRQVHFMCNGIRMDPLTSNIIWVMNSGCDVPPGYMVTHANRNPDDERICNLRLATPAQHASTRIARKSKSGERGIRVFTNYIRAEIRWTGPDKKIMCEWHNFEPDEMEKAKAWRRAKELEIWGPLAVRDEEEWYQRAADEVMIEKRYWRQHRETTNAERKARRDAERKAAAEKQEKIKRGILVSKAEVSNIKLSHIRRRNTAANAETVSFSLI